MVLAYLGGKGLRHGIMGWCRYLHLLRVRVVTALEPLWPWAATTSWLGRPPDDQQPCDLCVAYGCLGEGERVWILFVLKVHCKYWFAESPQLGLWGLFMNPKPRLHRIFGVLIITPLMHLTGLRKIHSGVAWALSWWWHCGTFNWRGRTESKTSTTNSGQSEICGGLLPHWVERKSTGTLKDVSEKKKSHSEAMQLFLERESPLYDNKQRRGISLPLCKINEAALIGVLFAWLLWDLCLGGAPTVLLATRSQKLLIYIIYIRNWPLATSKVSEGYCPFLH